MPSPSVTSPQVALNDIGSAEDFLAAIDKTIKYFNDGDIVEGTIVKVDRDEVLLDIVEVFDGLVDGGHEILGRADVIDGYLRRGGDGTWHLVGCSGQV